MSFSSKPPFGVSVTDSSGIMSRVWQSFFRLIADVLQYLGQETTEDLVNNSTNANLNDVKFDYQNESYVIFEYFAQRIYSGGVYHEGGYVAFYYDYDGNSWVKIVDVSYDDPSNSVTFDITAAGQVQYTTTNISGSPTMDRVTFRIRKFAAKSSLYSRA